jgi:uncharacterized protein YbcV (DUF1398 family)
MTSVYQLWASAYDQYRADHRETILSLAIALPLTGAGVNFSAYGFKALLLKFKGRRLIISIMFTLGQIHEIHDRLGNAETLTQYLQVLKAIGVEKCDSFVTDGHSEYLGKNNQKVVSPQAHEILTVAKRSNREKLIEHLDLHNQRKTNYLEMSKGLADSGVEKWTFDTNNLTITYCDKAGNELFTEAIK